MTVPLYLQKPEPNGRTYGELAFDDGDNHYEIRAEPMVLEFAKRVFPGCETRHKKDTLRFAATRRMVAELNWLMMRYPLDVKCNGRFDQDLEKAVQHAQRRQANETLAPTTPPPSFTGTLRTYQAEGVTFMVQNERCLLVDDMGLGKTVTALAAMSTAECWPALVVCEPNIMRQWARQIESFLAFAWSGTLLGDLVHRIKGLRPYDLPDVPIYVIHYGLLAAWREALSEKSLQAVVFDEIQALRHQNTQKYSAASILAGECRYAWGLSGTPIYNYGAEIWSVLNIVDYHCLGDRDSFTREWCTYYGGEKIAKPKVLGEYLKTEGLLLRRRKSDVKSQLPPKRRATITVDHDEDLYAKLIAEAVELARAYAKENAWAKKGQLSRDIERETRHATGVAKLDASASFVKTLLEAGERPLIFAWHHDVHDGLEEALHGYQLVRVTGKESGARKDESVQRFRSGTADAILLSLRTSAGIDGLQEKGTCVVFVELDWSPAVHAQCEDRLHRQGLKHESILCYYLVSATGFDEIMQDVLGEKLEQFEGLFGQGETDGQDEAIAKDHLQKLIARLQESRA